MIVNPNGSVSVSMMPNYALTPLSYQPINMLMQMLQQMQGMQLAPPPAPVQAKVAPVQTALAQPAALPELGYEDVNGIFSIQPKGMPYAMGHGQAPAQTTQAAPSAQAATYSDFDPDAAANNLGGGPGLAATLLGGLGLAELLRRAFKTELVGASVVPQEGLPADAASKALPQSALPSGTSPKTIPPAPTPTPLSGSSPKGLPPAGTSIKPVPPAPTPSPLSGSSPKGLPPAGAAASLALEAPAQGVPVTWETPTASAAPVRQPPTVIDVAATPVTALREPTIPNVVNATPPKVTPVIPQTPFASIFDSFLNNAGLQPFQNIPDDFLSQKIRNIMALPQKESPAPPSAAPKEVKQTTTAAAPAENLQSLTEEYNKLAKSVEQLGKTINIDKALAGDNVEAAAYGTYEKLKAKERAMFIKLMAEQAKKNGGAAMSQLKGNMALGLPIALGMVGLSKLLSPETAQAAPPVDPNDIEARLKAQEKPLEPAWNPLETLITGPLGAGGSLLRALVNMFSDAALTNLYYGLVH